MKKILIPVLSVLAVLTACNQDLLEIPQKGVIYTENFYNTDEDAEAALVAAYSSLLGDLSTSNMSIYNPMHFAYNLCGDDLFAAGEFFGDNDFAAALNEFRHDTSSEVLYKAYSNFYYVIYHCNLVLSNFENGLKEGGHTAVTKRVVAEARVLRAYCYMMLAIGWGTPPHVLQPIGVYDFPTNYDGTQADLLRWCAKECETALPELTERESKADKLGAVKVTKGFANAIAGKCYVFAGDFTEAKSALEAVISSDKYALVPGDRLWENFHVPGDGNEEKVFEVNIQTTGSVGWYGSYTTWMESNIWGWRSDHFVVSPNNPLTGIDGWGGLGVPEWFAETFIENDGLDSKRLQNSIISIEDAVYNTTYGLADVDNLTLDQKKTSDKLGIKGSGLYGQSFYLAKKQQPMKFVDFFYPGDNCRLNNFILMRYAEVLLLYAEACLKADTPDPAKALEVVNMIQERAGSKTVSTSVDMNVIEREKLLELWLEGSRWPDMVRWQKFDRAKNAAQAVPVMYDKVTRTPAATDKNVQWNHGSESNSRFYTVDTQAAIDAGYEVGFKEGKHELFPFPFNITRVNKVLVQNPGW